MPRTKRPAPVAWCDEHGRYFFWKTGCTKDGKKQPTPTNEEVRAYYDWARDNLSGGSGS
jgi:hypothetical protein